MAADAFSKRELTTIDLDFVVRHTFLAGAEHHAVLGSTNDRARTLAAEARQPLPWLVLADQQTAGRGRGANRWWTGQGSLALSLLLDPAGLGIARPQCGLISLAAAVALVDCLAPLLEDPTLGLHWPNDVYVRGKKIAGILVEALSDGRHIVGIGLNVNNSLAETPPEIAELATTLSDLSGRRHEPTQLLTSLLERLESTFTSLAGSPQSLGLRVNDLCLQHGRSLTIECGQQTTSGCCQGVDVDGALLLATSEGLKRFYGGVLRRGSGQQA